MATKEEYVQAAVDRIKDWCRSTSCKIPNIAYTAITSELKTMFECSPHKRVDKMNEEWNFGSQKTRIPATWPVGTKIRIAEGWRDTGRVGSILGAQIFVGQWWCPILWDDEEDPGFHKSAGIELEI